MTRVGVGVELEVLKKLVLTILREVRLSGLLSSPDGQEG